MWQGTWKLALTYGVAAFATGFVFGIFRELVLRPWLGEPAAHWAEFPLVTGLVCVLGCRIGRASAGRIEAWLAGAGGLAILLVIESAFALGLLRQTMDVYLASFDIRQGALFPVGLAAMLLAPWLGWRTR